MKYYPSRIRSQIAHEIRHSRLLRNAYLQFLFRLLPPALGDKIGYRWAKKQMEKELAKPTGNKVIYVKAG